jgi:hydroxyethylthiazole kinase-like uncharacterized protein yjeF
MNELITVAQMRAIDARSAELGVATRTLMENAGRAVADAICARFSPRKTAVLCGPGANGGDGWVAARVLQQRGWPVWVETLVPREALRGDAASAAAAFTGETFAVSENNPMAELFVDALFGAGLSRPLEGDAARLAQALPAARVVAVDAPSGLPGDGDPPQGPAFGAALTVTFVRKKPAHVLAPGRLLCGETIVADIGAPAAALAAQDIRLWENAPTLWSIPRPAPDAHKHARGHCMVVSGPAHATGAARLAARAALRVGAGLVTVLAAGDALAANAAHLTAVMLAETEDAAAIAAAAARAQSIVIGPAAGVDARTRQAVEMLAAVQGRRVLDADALTCFADDPAALSAALRADDVLTPHPGEFRRLFPDLAAVPRLAAARAAAQRAGAVVLLKGPDTVIAAPDGRAVINATGSPYLATAGSGDVLAGLIGGLLAQGLDGFAAACCGAWLHGRLGELLGAGLIAEDLPEALPNLLKDLA